MSKPVRAVLSGFCNPSYPLGHPSHGRCRKTDCPCFCHWKENTVPTKTTDKVGFFDDLDEAVYHADRDSLSVSGAKTLLKAPALFRWQQDHPVYKSVFDFGTAAHREVLGVGPKLVIHSFDPDKVKSPKATTAWKEEQKACRERGDVLLLPDEYVTVQAMALQLERHPTAIGLLEGGRPEVSAYAQHDGLRLRCRYDYLGDGYGVDYKSTASAEPHAFTRSVANLGYDMQADWYLHVAELNGQPLEAFHFIAQEKEPPYIVEVYQLDADFLARGRRRNDQARELYAECVAADDWSRGYTGLPFSTLSPPAWTRYESGVNTPAGIPADFTWSLDDYTS